MTSGSICEPPLIVRVAVVLMKGRTPMRVYTSGLVVLAAVAGEGAPAARPTAAATLPPQKTSRRLSPAMDRFIGSRMFLVSLFFARFTSGIWLESGTRPRH